MRNRIADIFARRGVPAVGGVGCIGKRAKHLEILNRGKRARLELRISSLALFVLLFEAGDELPESSRGGHLPTENSAKEYRDEPRSRSKTCNSSQVPLKCDSARSDPTRRPHGSFDTGARFGRYVSTLVLMNLAPAVADRRDQAEGCAVPNRRYLEEAPNGGEASAFLCMPK